MPAFKAQESQMLLNRMPRVSYNSGCFENGITTGERVWTVLAERLNYQKERDSHFYNNDNGDESFLQVGQTVSVNFDGRLMSGSVVRKIPCSHNVELCLHDGASSRVVVDQQQILQNTEEFDASPQKISEISHPNSWKRNAPLVIDIPHYNETFFESSDENTEEKMAAAVLTSLSLSPVLKHMEVKHGEILEEARISEKGSDEEITPAVLSDDEHNMETECKPRRKKSSTKIVFQCTWPHCGIVLANSSAITRHVRAWHLGPKDEGYSDGEEDFYFIEVEPEGTADFPREISPRPTSRPTSRRARSFSDPSMPTQPPVSPTSQPNFTWPLRTTGSRSKPKRPLHQTVHPRKGRGDGKKCRKVFGMENKQLWCTQCRWKKACVKFAD